MNKTIVLASGSPRRKALLTDLGIKVDVRVSDAEETSEGSPDEVVTHNARVKCEAIARNSQPDEIIIAADTIVVHEGSILGKPRSLEEAVEMLERLSGDTHEVKTGIHVRDIAKGQQQHDIETTRVTFRELKPEEIGRFVEIVQPLDRAGAYTVDGPGSLLVAGYEGCYYNVLGLPLVLLHGMLLELGFDLFSEMNAQDARFL